MLEFAHPQFLWALPAVSLPVLIHLLNRRRYRTVSWAAMDYLRRAERRTRRRIRWQNVLLLLVRTAAVLVLVALFARPSITALRAAVPAEGNVVILLDDSASMAQRRDGEDAFETAKRFTLSVAEELSGAGAGLTVYVAGAEERVVAIPSVGPNELSVLQRELERLRTVPLSFEPAGRLPGLTAGAAAGRRFYVVTDLRAADWGEGALRSEVRRALADLQEHGPVTLVDVGPGDAANAGIVEVLGTDRPAYARQVASLRAVVHNSGDRPMPPTRMDVRLDGPTSGPLPPVSVPAVPAGESREAPLDLFLAEAGQWAVGLSLRTEDAFRPDDRRFVVLEAVERLPVLLVEGAEGGASFYLRRALAPTPDAGGLRVHVRPVSAGPPAELDTYAAIFLCDVASPAAWQEALGRYVDGGGRLVVFLGPHVQSEAWNDASASGDALLPAALGAPVSAESEGEFRLAELAFSHPLLRPFAEWERLFSSVRVSRFVEAMPGDDAQVLARFDDGRGSPAIVTATKGNGRVVLLTTSADDEWTDWPRSELGRVTYLSLMQWLVEQGRSAAPPDLNRRDGAGFELLAGRFGLDGGAMLRPPGGDAASAQAPRALRPEPVSGRAGLWLLSGPLRQEGIWQLTPSGGHGRRSGAYVAVNVPARERRLARLDSQALREAAAGLGRVQLVRYDGTETTAGAGSGPASSLHRLIAFTLLALLLADSLLAYVFGNPKRPGPSRGASEDGRSWR